jgi:hypothetical protein
VALEVQFEPAMVAQSVVVDARGATVRLPAGTSADYVAAVARLLAEPR